MPARIVVVDEDWELLAGVVSALEQHGFEVKGFSDSIEAYELLRTASEIEILVTGVEFRSGLHGVALAGAAALRRPDLQTIFIARPDLARHVQGQGRILLRPVSPEQVCAAVLEVIGT